MFQEIDPKQQDKFEGSSNNFEETLRRIEPFIRKPVEEPRKFHPWTTSESGRTIRPSQVTSKIIHTQFRS